MLIDRELSSIGDNLIAFGFVARNELGARFIFKMDQITVRHVDYMWRISEGLHDDANFFTLRELIESEFWRWQNDD